MSRITPYILQFFVMIVMTIFKLMGLEISWWVVFCPIWINIILFILVLDIMIIIDVIEVFAGKKKINQIAESVNKDEETGILKNMMK